VAIKVIVELRARPGGRAELQDWLESLVADHGSREAGFLGSVRYEVLDDPDMLVEIAEWESVEARLVHMQDSATTGVYAPLSGMLVSPPRATVIREMP
jgi:quinol monooxygenase YgiN